MDPIETRRLEPHPACTVPAGVSVWADVSLRPDGGWQIQFRISDPNGAIRWPDTMPPCAADGLWQSTCCEAFVAVPESDAYVEFNMSPSGRWACYRFASYRTRADQGQPTWRPAIECAHHGQDTSVRATITPDLLPPFAANVGLCCVIESVDGTLSYWALAHPQAQPDFHHREGFALKLGKERAV